MHHLGRLTLAVMLGALLAACNHPAAPAISSTSSAAASAPTHPAANANESIWGAYLAGQGKLHAKDVSMRPYIYVVPPGDGMAARTRRASEVESVVHSIGPLVLPGGMLIVGGPDPKLTTRFLGEVAKQLKANSLNGIVVMVVSAPSEEAPVIAALKASGATVRFVTM